MVRYSIDWYKPDTALISATTGTVVATLLSPIGAHFNRSNRSSYIGTAYLLSVCCFTPLYGRLSDILGRKGAMLLALSLFGSGTFLCGIAPSMNVLIVARAIAGMGGGGSVLQFHAIRCWSQCLRSRSQSHDWSVEFASR